MLRFIYVEFFPSASTASGPATEILSYYGKLQANASDHVIHRGYIRKVKPC